MKNIVSKVSSLNKWLILSGLALLLLSARPLPVHPFHVSVTEINHNAQARTLEISCKFFTDDFESALAKGYSGKVDLTHPADRNKMDSLIKKYIFSRLTVKVNSQAVRMNYLGYEIENEAVYAYVEGEGVPAVSKLDMSNALMYDVFDDQVNIIHVIVDGKRRSNKLNYPDKELSLSY